jgi:hypothetical protein
MNYIFLIKWTKSDISFADLFAIVIVLVMIFCKTQIVGQPLYGSISGYILDQSTKNPVENANIYLSNTMVGTASNNSGNYRIERIPVGVYTIIISCVGYELYTQKVDIENNREIQLNAAINKKIYELPTILIETEEESKWHKNYEIFFSEFVGTNSNASKCKIIDPYKIDFYVDEEGRLYAESKEPVKIINQALGYEIIYFLEYFEHYDGTTKFNGLPVFNEVDTNDIDMKNIWQYNRLKTYCGSVNHFLAASARDYDNYQSASTNEDSIFNLSLLDQFGFKVLEVNTDDIVYNKQKPARLIQSPEFIFNSEVADQKIISFNEMIQINYLKKMEEEEYLKFLGVNRFPQHITSFLRLHSPWVQFDTKGRYYDKFQLELLGYWAFSRVADMLPYEYTVEDSILKSVNFLSIKK